MAFLQARWFTFNILQRQKRMQNSVLIIEDEERIAKWIKRYFEQESFLVYVENNGLAGLRAAYKLKPDLIILDLMLPDITGEDICVRLRKNSNTPIIMLTARDTQRDRINGLKIGADDYVVKPFDPQELIARARAVLRRAKSLEFPIKKIGPFEYTPQEKRIVLDGKPLALTIQQFTILATFLENPNRLLSREQLIELAFKDFDGFDRAVDTHIKRIRKIIEPESGKPRYLKTVYGAGYRFEP